MGSLLARASQLVNLSLFGSAIGLFVWAAGAGETFIARAEPPAIAITETKPPVPLRPETAQPATGQRPGLPLQVFDTKGDAVVPPLQRKRPAPGQTSIPIVAPPDKKVAKPKPTPATPGAVRPVAQAAPAALPAPAPKSTKPATKAKSAPATQRAGLGAKPGEIVPKCGTGLRYDSKQLKCVKPASSQGPAVTPTASKSLPTPVVNTKAVAPAAR